jgi:hypothetical protein
MIENQSVAFPWQMKHTSISPRAMDCKTLWLLPQRTLQVQGISQSSYDYDYHPIGAEHNRRH